MMRRNAFLVWILLLISFTAGCATRDRYAYDAIRADTQNAAARPEGQRVNPQTVLPEGPLSLRDAIRIALVNNPDLQMAAARIRQTDALIEKSRSAFYPTLGFYTEYLRGNAPSAYLFKKIDQREIDFSEDFNNPDVFDNFESGLNARWNLYRGGRDHLGHQMAETGRTISHLDRQSVHNALAASVIQTYYDHLTAGAFIEIARNSVATVADQLRVMTVRYDAGGALKSDLLSLRVRRSEAQEEEVRSRNQLALTRAALANLLGIDIRQPLALAETATTGLSVPDQFDGGLAYALGHRPEIQGLHEKVRQSRMAVDKAQAGYIPSIDAFGKLYYDDEDMSYDLDRENWTAGILFNWELFQGFYTRADENEARAIFEEMLLRDRKTTLAVELEVKTAYLGLADAQARLEVAHQRVANAEESLNLVAQQYEGGSATVTRYLEAELACNQARLSQAAALYDREKAVADIARAIGYLAVAYPVSTE